MNKENFLKVYYKMCVVIAMGAFLSLFLYLSKFPEGMNGDINKTFFTLEFNIMYGQQVIVFNSMVIVFFAIFLINLGMFIYVLLSKKTEGLLAEGTFYNTIITFLLLVSHLAYHLQIPPIVNGTITHSFLYSNFYRLTDVKIMVFNFSYLLISVYLFYNVFVIYKTMPRVNNDEVVE